MLELCDVRNDSIPVRIERPSRSSGVDVEGEVLGIVQDVRLRGDAALLEYTSKFDGARLSTDGLRVDPVTISAASSLVPPAFVAALEALLADCRRRAETSLRHAGIRSQEDEIDATELIRPLRRVGVYVPRGSAGRASDVISSVVPAQVAGVQGVAVCSAPDGSGEVPEPILAACAVAGVTEVYRLGGAQAIAALAYGTQTVRPVEKIVASGGAFVRSAQRSVRGWVGTGPDAGPSELVVIADGDASPQLIAAELAANAARGPQGTHVVISDAPDLLEEVIGALDVVADADDASGAIENGLIEGGHAILVRDLDQAFTIVNTFAPQYLMLAIRDPDALLPKVRNAGVLLLGQEVSRHANVFLSGAGGVVPTGGSARWDSALSPRDFAKTITVARTDPSERDPLAAHLEALSQTERRDRDRALGSRSQP
jgi:histidinol dehydrogenase